MLENLLIQTQHSVNTSHEMNREFFYLTFIPLLFLWTEKFCLHNLRSSETPNTFDSYSHSLCCKQITLDWVVNSRYWGNRSKMFCAHQILDWKLCLGPEVSICCMHRSKSAAWALGWESSRKSNARKSWKSGGGTKPEKKGILCNLMSVMVSEWNWDQGEKDIFGCPAAGKIGVYCLSPWLLSMFHLCSTGCVGEWIFVQVIWERMG